MPRIKVSTPDNPRFRMERKVGISDLNYAKHLDSTAMVAILHEARLQMLGFTVNNAALDQIVCKAKAGVVFMDFDKHQLADVPAAFKTRIEMPQVRVA